jgi:DNA-binding IclR family transcriptional regulator
VVAVGRPVRTPDGQAVACLSLSMPSVRYDPHRLASWVATIGSTVRAVEADLASSAS